MTTDTILLTPELWTMRQVVQYQEALTLRYPDRRFIVLPPGVKPAGRADEPQAIVSCAWCGVWQARTSKCNMCGAPMEWDEKGMP